MKRRELLRSLSVMGGAAFLAPGIWSREAQAQMNARAMSTHRSKVLGEINYLRPAVLPQVISIFLYGGPSELGGNLTNMAEINAQSQNKYDTRLEAGKQNTFVTANGFWGGGDNGAGGETMERMLSANRLSVYRTVNRVKDDSKAHRPSIFSNLTGMIGEDDTRPGIATNLAAILSANGVIAGDARFPFVSFEGESLVFSQGDSIILPHLKPVTLTENFDNPYVRSQNRFADKAETGIEDLAKAISGGQGPRFEKAALALTKRAEVATFITGLATRVKTPTLPTDPDDATKTLAYPNTNFGNRLKAAAILAIESPETLFISLGSGGLGGWDDHDSATGSYTQRLRELMSALEVAAKHFDAVGKNNVIINVFGDFGRNANLNNSLGWDHGNNQNLYTVSGNGVAGRKLGKIVGRTILQGKADQNRLFTTPAADSYQFEPFSIASTMYKYFGVQNPEVLSGEAPIDENAANERKG